MDSTINKPAFSKNCLISHRPQFQTDSPLFYRCPDCGALYIKNIPHPDQIQANSTKTKDWLEGATKISCCGHELSPMVPLEHEDIPEGHELKFTVFGGFHNTSVKVEVAGGLHPMDADHRIEWIYYRGFQGGQLKYLPARSRSTAIFSFAEEDAFVYCDRDICRMGHEHCKFCCRRSNEVYAYCSKHGLLKLYMDGF